jgi:hypothetical protein
MPASSGNILEHLANGEIDSISAAEQIANRQKAEPKSYTKNLHILAAALVPESDKLDWNAITKSIFVNTPGLILDIQAFENGDQIQILSD